MFCSKPVFQLLSQENVKKTHEMGDKKLQKTMKNYKKLYKICRMALLLC